MRNLKSFSHLPYDQVGPDDEEPEQEHEVEGLDGLLEALGEVAQSGGVSRERGVEVEVEVDGREESRRRHRSRW